MIMAKLQMMVFELAGNKYSIDIKYINSIVKAKNYRIVTLPKDSDYIKGITNIRGKVYPVFSMRKKFGFDEIPIDSDTKFVLISFNDKDLAIVVDEVTDILKLDDSELMDAQHIKKSNENMTYVVQMDDMLIIGLNVTKIFETESVLSLDIPNI
jgi:purine-binding chemotaxis protein CheW